MSTDEVLKKILGLPVERIRVLFKASQGFERKRISRDLGISVSTYDYHMDKAVEEFEPLIPELYDTEPQESKRDRLLTAIERDVLELFKPYKINPEDLTEELWDRIRLGFEPIPGSEDNQKEKKSKPIDPTAKEHPAPSFRELITIQIRRLWDHIPEGLPRILIPGIGLSLVVVLLIWGLTECWGLSPGPVEVAEVSTQEPTEVGQVVPPVETEAPPTDTEIPPTTVVPTVTLTPTITSTPTTTTTPTITSTPTIEPTDVGLENLPLTFEGQYDEDVYWPEPMMIKIESKDGDTVSGTFLFTDRGRVTGWDGSVVYNFDDSAELARWLFVEGFETDGIHIIVTRTWEIAGGGVGGSGDRYYIHISPTGIISGVRYRTISRTTPSAIINLTLSE